jgi:hypothetical protein
MATCILIDGNNPGQCAGDCGINNGNFPAQLGQLRNCVENNCGNSCG